MPKLQQKSLLTKAVFHFVEIRNSVAKEGYLQYNIIVQHSATRGTCHTTLTSPFVPNFRFGNLKDETLLVSGRAEEVGHV